MYQWSFAFYKAMKAVQHGWIFCQHRKFDTAEEECRAWFEQMNSGGGGAGGGGGPGDSDDENPFTKYENDDTPESSIFIKKRNGDPWNILF